MGIEESLTQDNPLFGSAEAAQKQAREIAQIERDNLKVVNFTNIDREDFVGSWGGDQETIRAGETIQLVKFKADHYCKHLIDKILHRDKPTAFFDDKNLRDPLEDQILGKVKPSARIGTVPTPDIPATPPEPEFAGIPVDNQINDTATRTEERKILPYMCGICGKSFEFSVALSGHLKSHQTGK